MENLETPGKTGTVGRYGKLTDQKQLCYDIHIVMIFVNKRQGQNLNNLTLKQHALSFHARGVRFRGAHTKQSRASMPKEVPTGSKLQHFPPNRIQ